MTSCHDLYDEDLPPRQIVVGVDDSAASRAALAWALDQARASGAAVIAVNVVEPLMPLDFAGSGFYATSATFNNRELRLAAHELIDRMVLEVTDGRAVDVQTRVIEGSSPGKVLVRAARNAAMLVVGTHHRHGLGFLLGSTGASCLRHATCPVMVVPETWGLPVRATTDRRREVSA